MGIYYVIGGLVLGAALLGPWSMTAETRTRLALAFALLLALLAGLRGEECCRDYIVYRAYYSDAPSALSPGSFVAEWLDSLAAVDVGFVFFNTLLKSVGVPFEGLLLSVALAAVLLTVGAYTKSTPYPLLALAFYYTHPFFYREMIQIRAGLACAISLWVYILLARGSLRWAAVTGVLAVSMHLSAVLILMPVVLFQRGMRLTMRRVLATLVVSYVVSVVVTPELELFAAINRVAVYLDSEYAGQVGVFTNPTTLKQIAVLLAVVFVNDRWGFDRLERLTQLCIASYFVATVWLITFNSFEIIGARGASFISFVEPILIANTVWRIRELRPELARIANVTAVALAGLILFMNLGVKGVVDGYTSWLAG